MTKARTSLHSLKAMEFEYIRTETRLGTELDIFESQDAHRVELAISWCPESGFPELQKLSSPSLGITEIVVEEAPDQEVDCEILEAILFERLESDANFIARLIMQEDEMPESMEMG